MFELWIAVGFIAFCGEMFLVPAMGLVFFSLGCFCTAALLGLGFVSEDSLQLQLFLTFIFSSLWAALLWKPLKKFRLDHKTPRYKNMVGQKAVVCDAPLTKNAEGTVRWSGTVMRARLVPGSAISMYSVGSEVEITKIEGNMVWVE